MANNQSQNSSRTQSGNSSGSQRSQSQSQSSSSTPSTSSSASMNSGSNAGMNSGSGDAIEQAITKGVRSLLDTVEPQLNRIGTQLVNRVMSRGQEVADTGVRRMQDQPWYMVGGALALVAVGVGLLFAFDSDATAKPDYSRHQ